MTRMALLLIAMVFVVGLAPAKAQADACNGSSCTVNGTTLNCPSSGGPTCADGETCKCLCKDLGQHNYITYNACVKPKPSPKAEDGLLLNEMLN